MPDGIGIGRTRLHIATDVTCLTAFGLYVNNYLLPRWHAYGIVYTTEQLRFSSIPIDRSTTANYMQKSRSYVTSAAAAR